MMPYCRGLKKSQENLFTIYCEEENSFLKGVWHGLFTPCGSKKLVYIHYCIWVFFFHLACIFFTIQRYAHHPGLVWTKEALLFVHRKRPIFWLHAHGPSYSIYLYQVWQFTFVLIFYSETVIYYILKANHKTVYSFSVLTMNWMMLIPK